MGEGRSVGMEGGRWRSVRRSSICRRLDIRRRRRRGRGGDDEGRICLGIVRVEMDNWVWEYD